MFCPVCGVEEREPTQFCRACGSDLRSVRVAVAEPDSVTASAASAREDIGRAIADRIRAARTAEELAVVADEVLPEVEKFLESPAEKRLRRIRTGTILSCIGMGTAIGITIVSTMMPDEDVIFLAALGLVCFFIGLAFVINGVFLTVSDSKNEEVGSLGGLRPAGAADMTGPNELEAPAARDLFSSVTEGTTRHLKDKVQR